MHLGGEVREAARLRGGGPQAEHRQRAGGGEQPGGAGDRLGVGEQLGQVAQVLDLGEHGLLVLVADGVGRGLGGGGLPGAEFAQLLAQRRVAVVAEGHGEAGHRGLADAGEFGDLDAGEERRLGGVPDQRVRDPPLGGGEPVPLEELEQPGGGTDRAGVVGGGHGGTSGCELFGRLCSSGPPLAKTSRPTGHRARPPGAVPGRAPRGCRTDFEGGAGRLGVTLISP